MGDTDNKLFAKGFYISLIQKAFEDLALDTFFDERRETFDFPEEGLTLPLPEGCFNVRNVYLLNGTECNISETNKVYWKRNYFTEGIGYVANDKGINLYDPFYTHRGNGHHIGNNRDNGLQRFSPQVEHRFFYNIQGGNIMFSSSCRGKSNKVHIHYNGTGCAIDEVPIIPIYLRTAIEYYVIETVLRMRMALEADRKWGQLQVMYEKRLNKDGQWGNWGVWQNAELRIKRLNTSQRNELAEYLSKPAAGRGY